MITVLVYCGGVRQHIEEFKRRFYGKFNFNVSNTIIQWEHMRIHFVTTEVRGFRADIVIGFNQLGINALTMNSCINIKEKRTTTYLELLDSINEDGTLNWKKYFETAGCNIPWFL